MGWLGTAASGSGEFAGRTGWWGGGGLIKEFGIPDVQLTAEKKKENKQAEQTAQQSP